MPGSGSCGFAADERAETTRALLAEWFEVPGGVSAPTDADGSSRVTIPGYAAGIVDQLENPAAHRKQITFAD